MTRSHGQADEPQGVDQPELEHGGRRRFTQAHREALTAPAQGRPSEFEGYIGGVFRKKSRVIAIRIVGPFEVETEHGVVTCHDGWLATNHPDDDSGSDVWPISDERLRRTYDRFD